MGSPQAIEKVNIRQGAHSHHGLSQGNCLPLIAIPFGMTHWSPQTAEGNWLFDARQRKLQGVRATHQPSPWIGDYGHFLVMAQTGTLQPHTEARASAYRPDRSIFRPDYFAADLIRYNTRLEMTPTERCAAYRFTFPATDQAHIVLEPCTGDGRVKLDIAGNRVQGLTRGKAGGATDNFALYYVARFDKPIARAQTFLNGKPFTDDSTLEGTRPGAVLTFDATDGQPITMQLGTSFISWEQAERNLDNEIGTAVFDTIREKAATIWNEALNRITVEGGTEDDQCTFASCLYRLHLFPRKWYEFDASGQPVHFSPYDGKVHPGILYADNGFWDTYRTVYPLLALLMPDQLSEILEGWTNACREGGWFPQWASPGYRACMVGTHVDAVMSDAVARGVRGFDLETAYAGLRKHAFEAGDRDGNYGRIGIADYLEKGYVADDNHHESVARSLDYAYDDYCLAQIACVLGKAEDTDTFLTRAKNYTHLYDPSVGFMRGKNADGTWAAFREFQWGSPYVEGGPWQSSWAVPHDAQGLIQLMGGKERFLSRLEQMLTMPPHFEVGHYGFEIHEMTEMAVVDFGQYAQSNQPVHHVLYLFTAAGRPDRTQYYVRRVLKELYTPDAFPGDEDNGEMSAWYLLSAMGLFPYCPGHASWVIGAPLFDRIRVTLPNGKALTIEAERTDDSQLYSESLSLNGEAHRALWIDHATVAAGATLRHTMTETPAFRESYTPEELPFSLSTPPSN